MAAYNDLLAALERGVLPIVLTDEEVPGGLPVVSLVVRNSHGAINQSYAHLFNPSAFMRACALIGLTVGAHKCWADHQRNTERN